MSVWRETTLADLASPDRYALATGPFGSAISSKHFVQQGIPVLRGSNLSLDVGVRLIDEGLAFLEPDKAATFTRSMAHHGDLVFTCWGTVGQIGLIDTRARFAEYVVSNKQMKLTPDPTKVESLFLYYLLSSAGMLAEVQGQSIGAAVPGFNLGQLRSIRVRIPPVAIQRKIARVLANLDDLSENNRHRIELLERMAQAIYREWFVHFRYPGHEHVPLVDTPLGPIPAGWAYTTLGDAARWLSGGTPSTHNPAYWGGDIPWITSGTLTSLLLDRSERMVTERGVANGTRLVGRDTLLFVVRGMSLVKEFRVGIADRSLAFGQDCKALIARPGIHPLFLAFAVICMRDEIQGKVELAGHGTGKLSTDRLKAIMIPQPPQELQAKFVEGISPMRNSITALRLSIDQLEGMRGLLLPPLVTGRIDVSNLDLDALVDSTA